MTPTLAPAAATDEERERLHDIVCHYVGPLTLADAILAAGFRLALANAETQAAIREARAGNVTRYDSVAALMDDLKAGEEPPDAYAQGLEAAAKIAADYARDSRSERQTADEIASCIRAAIAIQHYTATDVGK